MSDFTGTTRAQTLFLRAFHKHPHGPPPDLWPSPAVLRKWLRRPAFAAAFRSLRDTLRTQADLHLALAATQAAHALSTTLPDPATTSTTATTDDHPDLRPHLSPLMSLLRLSHLRQRFPSDPPLPERPPRSESSILEEMRYLHPSLPLGHALARFDLPHREDYNEDFHKQCNQNLAAGLDFLGNPIKHNHPFPLDDDDEEAPHAPSDP